jgi:hypothetical protein
MNLASMPLKNVRARWRGAVDAIIAQACFIYKKWARFLGSDY